MVGTKAPKVRSISAFTPLQWQERKHRRCGAYQRSHRYNGRNESTEGAEHISVHTATMAGTKTPKVRSISAFKSLQWQERKHRRCGPYQPGATPQDQIESKKERRAVGPVHHLKCRNSRPRPHGRGYSLPALCASDPFLSAKNLRFGSTD